MVVCNGVWAEFARAGSGGHTSGVHVSGVGGERVQAMAATRGWASSPHAILSLCGVPRSQNSKFRSVLPSRYEGIFVNIGRAYFT